MRKLTIWMMAFALIMGLPVISSAQTKPPATNFSHRVTSSAISESESTSQSSGEITSSDSATTSGAVSESESTSRAHRTPIYICVDNTVLDVKSFEFYGQQPVIEEDRLLIPVRKVFETLGYKTEYNVKDDSAVFTGGGKRIQVWNGKAEFSFSDDPTWNKDWEKTVEYRELHGPAMVSDLERFLIPFDDISKVLGINIEWDDRYGNSQILYIFSSRLIGSKEDAMAKARLEIGKQIIQHF